MQENMIKRVDQSLNENSVFDIYQSSEDEQSYSSNKKTKENIQKKDKNQNQASTSDFIFDESSEDQKPQKEKENIKKEKENNLKKVNQNQSILEMKQLLQVLPDNFEEIKKIKGKKNIKPFKDYIEMKKVYDEINHRTGNHIFHRDKFINRQSKQQLYQAKSNNINKFKNYNNYSKFNTPKEIKNLKIHQTIHHKTQKYFGSQSFIFKNTLIQIKLSSFLKTIADVILVPFSSQKFDQGIAKIVVEKLKYSMAIIMKKQTEKKQNKEISEGQLFSVKAKGLNNFKGVYFLRSPYKVKNLKYFTIETLKSALKKVFQFVDRNQDQSIVIPDFSWGELQKKQIYEIVICSIFRCINEFKKQCKCFNLHKITIPISDCQDFQKYSKVFKSYISCFQNKPLLI